MSTAANPSVRQERDIVPRGAIYGAAFVLASILTAGWLLTWAIERHAPFRQGLQTTVAATPVPREIQMIDQTLFSAHEPSRGEWDEKERALRSYDWADPDHRTVRIPIDKAMQMLVERGHVE